MSLTFLENSISVYINNSSALQYSAKGKKNQLCDGSLKTVFSKIYNARSQALYKVLTGRQAEFCFLFL